MYLLFNALLLLSCETTKSVKTSPLKEQEKVLYNKRELTADRVEFYKTEFPYAERFIENKIPPSFLSEIDKGNSVYYYVEDSAGTVIGYLRDFMGPVTNDEECACSPLSLTLAYNKDLSFRNILSVAPLQKYGHEDLTEDEHKQMVQIAKKPSTELLKLKAPQEMIDGVSGATKLDYRDHVVEKAGYSSWRIANLAVETGQIIRGVPIQRDADRLQAMLKGAQTDSEQSTIIIDFIPTAESDYLKQRALFILAEIYMNRILSGESKDSAAEKVLLNSGLGAFQEAELLTSVCMAFVEEKQALSFVSSCVQKLERNPQREHFESTTQILKGLLLMEEGSVDEAIIHLENGLSIGKHSPVFRQRLAILYKELGRTSEYCTQLEAIYIDAPLWPNLDEFLASCGDVQETTTRLDQSRKKQILSTRIPTPIKVSSMQLLNESGLRENIDFTNGNKLRVVVFFATWCPHCQNEMPRLVEFYNQLQDSDLKDSVEFLPIRAAISRESQSFEDFKTQYNIPFPIMTDVGMTFDVFANEQGVNAGFPLIAITNTLGEVVYFPSHGDYSESVKELFWMLRSI